jgi:hypothetical protein
MPGPLDAFPRIDVGGNVAEQPTPPASFAELVGAHYRLGNAEGVLGDDRRIYDGYKPIIQALNIGANENPALYSEPGEFSPVADTYHGSNPTFAMPSPFDPTRARTRSEQEQRIASLIAARQASDPNFLRGTPTTVDALRAMMLKQDQERRAAARAAISTGHGVSSFVASLAGGAGSSMEDPYLLMTSSVGGVGRNALTRILTEGLGFAGVTAAEQPKVATVRHHVGEDYTAGDWVGNVGGAFVGGLLFRGAGEGLHAGGAAMGEQMRSWFPDWAKGRDETAFGKAMNRAVSLGTFDPSETPRVAARLMDPALGVRSDVEALAQVRRELGAGTIDDRALAAHFRLAVPEEMRTPEERGALAAIDRDATFAEMNPFAPSPAGLVEHDRRLAAAAHDLINDRVGIVPRGTPAAPPRQVALMSPDQVVRFVINDLEGGGRLVDNGDGAGPTKYGITARNHPGVDVANLTEDQAASLARQKYWMPEFYNAKPGVAPIAFDAFYLHGDANFARRLAAMDDPAQALRAYRDMLNRVADTVPGKAKFKKGWNARLDKLGARIGVEDAPFAAPELRPEFTAEDPGVEIVDRTSFAPERDGASSAVEALRSDVAQAIEDRRPVMLEDAAGQHRIVGATEAGLLDDKGVTIPHEAVLAPDGEAARVLIGPERPAAATDLREAAPPRPGGPIDVRRALAEAGGIADNEGHDLLGGRNLQRFVPGAGMWIRKSGGMSIDRAGEHLWERGYFGPPSTTERPTTAQVLELVERAAREKVYKPEESLAAVARDADGRRMPEDEALFHLAEHAREQGVHLDAQTLDEALGHLGRGETLEGAVSRAVESAKFRDAAPPAGLERFDDPDGEAFDAALESLEHDFRMDAEGDERLRGLFEQMDRERAGADAIRGCLAPPKMGAAE